MLRVQLRTDHGSLFAVTYSSPGTGAYNVELQRHLGNYRTSHMLFEIGLAAAAELWMAMDGHHNGSSLPGWTFPLTNLMMDFIFNVPEVDDFLNR